MINEIVNAILIDPAVYWSIAGIIALFVYLCCVVAGFYQANFSDSPSGYDEDFWLIVTLAGFFISAGLGAAWGIIALILGFILIISPALGICYLLALVMGKIAQHNRNKENKNTLETQKKTLTDKKAELKRLEAQLEIMESLGFNSDGEPISANDLFNQRQRIHTLKSEINSLSVEMAKQTIN